MTTPARTATFNVTGSTFRDSSGGRPEQPGQSALGDDRLRGVERTFNFTGANVFENDANTLPPGGTENWSDGILVTFEGPFPHTLNVQNATFHHLFQGMDIASNFCADVTYTILNNTITFTEGVAAIALGNGSSLDQPVTRDRLDPGEHDRNERSGPVRLAVSARASCSISGVKRRRK